MHAPSTMGMVDITPGDDDRVIVVGSGPCGAIAAARLVQRGVRVVMLDSGSVAPGGVIVRAAGNTLLRRRGRPSMVSDRHDVVRAERGTLDDATNPRVEWHSSLSHGGLSNFWTAAVPRFAPEDFTEGGALDERYRWPITYDDLVPYYEHAEELLTVTAGAPFANVPANVARYSTALPADWADIASRLAANGHSLGALPMAKGAPWMIARRGAEFSSYHCIVAALRQSPRFRLVSGAHVTQLLWSARTGGVDAVEHVDRLTGVRSRTRCRAVVVAAGAIDSTVVLLRSVAPDHPHGLGNSSGVIGRYLHDHPREWWTATPEHALTALAHPAYLSRGPYDAAAPLLATSLTFGLATRTQRLQTYARRTASSFGVQVFGTMVPQPDVGVTVPADRGAGTAECRPTLSLAYDQAALDNLVSARQRLVDVFASSGVRVTVPGPFHDATPGSSVHYGGSVRMHSSPEFGAVDRWNRLHDSPNVIVCDSSCFTTGPEKNPTLTAMAIADRAADRLADDLAGSTVIDDRPRE
jgi:choline dehydrogenase-like flavoprotein